MTVRVTTKSGTSVEVSRDMTLAQLQAKLAELGDINPRDLTVNWSPEPPVEWGAPWPGADFSGNVTL
jgi:hypothetical protein